MLMFVSGLVLFFAIHLVPILAPNIKENIITKSSKSVWMRSYTAISLIGFLLIVFGWGQFRPVAPIVYDPPSWGRDATMSLVWLAFILFSIPRKKPGRILVIVKHPMVTGVILWSLGHLLVNGDLASVMAFGSFLAFALLSRFSKIVKGDEGIKFVSYRGDIIGVVGGTVLYAAFVLWAHFWLFGVSPI
ncbi:MAG: NnrU family protein [Devosiaceae bacterium]|nr:NnrU family protein [Devosiaceae bacterium]